ncbi:hypothetical protein DFH07DRAFT_738525, partial [Mycena maculata]
MSNPTPQTRARSQIDMPALRTRGAPKKFTGKPADIIRFVNHLEKLFTENNVHDHVERIECLAEYCSRKVVHILEGMKNYATPNWPLLVTDMISMFDADKDSQRHKFSDLVKLTKKWRKYQIKSMSDWRKYFRQYTTVCGWLENQGLITEAEAERYLWQGMCSSLRHSIEDRLLAKDPARDMTKPFKKDDILKVVEAKFRRGRFDADVDSAESSSDESDSNSDSDSSDSSNEDSETELSPPKKSKKKSKSKTKRRTRRPRDTPAAPAIRPVVQKPSARATVVSDEVGELVKKMSRMNLEDPDYNYLYYQATTIDPHVAQCVRAPILSVKAPPFPPNNFMNNQYTPPAPNQFGHNPNANANRPLLRPEDRTCFGCGNRGHGVWECAKIAEVVGRGELKRGERGTLEWPDGRLLRRFNQQN